MSQYFEQFFRAWGETVVVESALLIAVTRIRRFTPHEVPLPRIKALAAGIFASTLTLPYLWLVLPEFVTSSTTLLLLGEPAVFFVEAIFLKHFLDVPWRFAAAYSAACNVASLGLGVVVLP